MNIKVVLFVIVLITAISIIAYLQWNKSKQKDTNQFKEGYVKNTGDWVATKVVERDKDYYTGENSAGVIIVFKKLDVTVSPCKNDQSRQCATANKQFKVMYP